MKKDSDKNHGTKILRLLELIEGADECIANSKKMENPLMVKQFEHQKAKLLQELNEIMSTYRLMVKVDDSGTMKAA